MLRYKCLVLDHDDTVVQTEKAIGYPYFKEYIERIRPGRTLTYPEYVADCNNRIFADMCREKWAFTDAELTEEYLGWKEYSLRHLPPIFPGIDRIIRRQKAEGGLVCVASLSSRDNITRDYAAHFGFLPDGIYDYDLPHAQRKPSPFALEDIMEKWKLSPGDILVVDDLKMGWMMASPLGVKTAFAAWSKADFPELGREMRALCDYTFETAGELERFLFEEDTL